MVAGGGGKEGVAPLCASKIQHAAHRPPCRSLFCCHAAVCCNGNVDIRGRMERGRMKSRCMPRVVAAALRQSADARHAACYAGGVVNKSDGNVHPGYLNHAREAPFVCGGWCPVVAVGR